MSKQPSVSCSVLCFRWIPVFSFYVWTLYVLGVLDEPLKICLLFTEPASLSYIGFLSPGLRDSLRKYHKYVVVKLLPQQWPHCQSVIFKDFHWLLKIFIVLFQMKCTYYVDSLDLLDFLCRISDCVMLFLWEENIYYVSVVHKVDDNHCPVYVSLDPHIHRYFQKM